MATGYTRNCLWGTCHGLVMTTGGPAPPPPSLGALRPHTPISTSWGVPASVPLVQPHLSELCLSAVVLAGPRGTEDPGAVPHGHLARAAGAQAEPRLRSAAAPALQQQRLHHLHRQLGGAAAAAGDGGRALPRAPHHHHPQPRRCRRLGRLRLRPPRLQVPQTVHKGGIHGGGDQLRGSREQETWGGGDEPRCERHFQPWAAGTA